MDKLQELKSRLSSPEDQALLEQLIAANTSEQQATATNHEFKSADPPAIDYDKLAETMIAKLKADGDAAAEMAEEVAAEPTDDVAPEYVGDMSPDAFRALIREELAALGATKAAPPTEDTATATKADDTTTVLEQQITNLTTQLKSLTDEQPRFNGYRPSQDGATITTEKAGGPEMDSALKAAEENYNKTMNFLAFGNAGGPNA